MARRWRETGIAVLGAGVVVALVLVLLQFVGDDEPTDQAVQPSPKPTSSTTSATKAKPKGPPKPSRWPRGLVVKVDNAPAARPHVGLQMADLIFVEPVEGGLSRMAAVYWGKRPSAVGPVRSARETDIQMLAQMRRPVLTYSGAAPELGPALARAPIVRATPRTKPAAFYRAGGRPSPHNLFVNPRRLPKTKQVSSPLPFGGAPKGGKKTKRFGVSYRSASYGFRWSPRKDNWAITLNGRPLTSAGTGRVRAGTIVVQRVTITRGQGIVDTAGDMSPVAKTVGKGKATVLRDGKAYAAKWSRPNPKRETVYRIARNNKRLPFAPGRVWVLLVPK
ncbi:DUF3048 domain-containing protein [Haloechinothrix halophila]|uniref:DUF3048 domain-containing protein n=1 Tax=Haloechinothrix halophila TaxID=1069073 RepID=UPI00040AC57C|nr:DUF3048 domain-containing protein [Haloechinothrix halophila]